ncbi:MAG: efflux RND transporter permease subunit [Pseudomonadota bacterium]
MIARIIAWCTANRFFVFLGTAFAIAWGIYALSNTNLDAIPDLSDTQVIVFTEWSGRSPDLVEDQITYPIVTSMIAAPKVRDVRGYSMFGLSFVYIIFEEGTDIYWARSRTLEYMSGIVDNLPADVTPELGPDATGVGWVFEYALVDKTGTQSLADLRSFQDWSLRYILEAVPGVAEVASIGGFVKQYQVTVDPNKLKALGIPLKHVIMSIKASNNDVGGRVLEMQGAEFFVRGRGYIKSVQDIEKVVIGMGKEDTPITVKDVANVKLGPDIRRGAAEWNGEGEVVGGIVVMRWGENALTVIEKVKKRIEEIKPSLPEGVELLIAYDRSDLIHRSINTLRDTLIKEMVIVALAIIIFLWHFKSSLIPIVTLPFAALLSFIPMYYLGITSNIMSLGGIAIAIGAMVDAAVILVENAHKHLEHWEQEGRKQDRAMVVLHAAQEVGRPLFFSLLILGVSFMPVYALQAQEGRLFRPLAFTENFSMLFAALVAITLVPVLMQIFIKPDDRPTPKGIRARISRFFTGGRILPEDEHPVSQAMFRIYGPIMRWILKHRKGTMIVTIILTLSIVPVYMRLGTEFMPPLNEGDILYMPTTLPGISIEEAKRWLQIQDQLIISFPEVETVFGKVGRARTATDPAPLSMVETTIHLKPMNEWPKVSKERWYSGWPWWTTLWFKPFLPDKKPRTWEELIAELDRTVKLPGTTNAWIMPIKTRIDMLTTGIRTPIGIKIFGPDLKVTQKIGEQIEATLPSISGTRSVFAERSTGGFFVDFDIDRDRIARYGLRVGDVEAVIESSIGGMNIGETIEGRERYPINVRYDRDLRANIDELKRVLVSTPSGAQIPIEQVADIKITSGPPVIKDENGMLTSWVYVDLKDGTDITGYVKKAKEIIAKNVQIPSGYYLAWSGQYEYIERAYKRLMVMIPLALFLIFLLLYINTRSLVRTIIVQLSVSFALVGAIWMIYILGYQMSIAVWVGIIALAGIDAETGVVMMLYLDLSFDHMVRNGRMRTMEDVEAASIHGAVQRVRPKLMAAVTTFVGLMPIMFAVTGAAGADVMKHIAAPMVGGMITSFISTLLIYPVVYTIWKWHFVMKKGKQLPKPEQATHYTEL